MDTMTTVKTWQDEYFTFAKKVQEPVLRYTGRVAETIARYVPERPGFMPEMPSFVPELPTLPTMHELVDNGLKFRKRMVDEQAVFVRQWVKAVAPVTGKFEAAAKPAAKPAPKAAAKPAARPAARRVVKAA